MSEPNKSIEQRVDVLERKVAGMPDTEGWTPEQIANAKARGILPVGTAAPNPLGRSLEALAAHQEAWNATPRTPAEALEHYGGPPSLVHLPQTIRLTCALDHHRVDFPRGWHLVSPCFTALLGSGYCGAELAPKEMLDALFAYPQD